MRTCKLRGAEVLLPGLLLAMCALLAACGLTSASGTVGGASSTPGTTQATAGPQGTIQPIPSSATTPSVALTATPGAVRLVLNKSSYAAGGSATVSIENGLDAQIAVTDHHTDCTYVQLQHLVAGSWKPVDLCKLLSPIHMVDLAPGSVTTQKITIPTGSAAAGTYRVALSYSNNMAYSATFTIG